MATNKKNHFLLSRGLKYKLRVAVSLMSILPLLVCMYLVSNFILPRTGTRLDITIAIAVSVFIAVIGFFVIKEIFDRVLSVTSEAKLIAAGDISRKVEAGREDEIGDLGESLNQLTQRIRLNMDELKNYGEKTAQINLDIQKRVLVLSSLLQISSLISQGAKLEDILKLTTEKSRLLANSDVAYLFFREEGFDEFQIKAVDGLNVQSLLQAKIKEETAGIFSKLIKSGRHLVMDNKNILPPNLREDLRQRLGLKNAMALPVYLKGRVAGILGIGNVKDSFLYAKDDLDLLDIFAKQVSIAVENDILMHKVEKLEIKDALTGLYNELFIRSRLQEEIKRAITYQRPCSFILLNVDNFQKFHESFGSLQAEGALKRVALLIRDSVSEIDRVARFGDNEFAVVLPEKNKRQAQETAENIRKKIEFTFSEEQDVNKRLTVSGGVSENPLDGINAEELVSKAKGLVSSAKQQGRNRIIAGIK